MPSQRHMFLPEDVSARWKDPGAYWGRSTHSSFQSSTGRRVDTHSFSLPFSLSLICISSHLLASCLFILLYYSLFSVSRAFIHRPTSSLRQHNGHRAPNPRIPGAAAPCFNGRRSNRPIVTDLHRGSLHPVDATS